VRHADADRVLPGAGVSLRDPNTVGSVPRTGIPAVRGQLNAAHEPRTDTGSTVVTSSIAVTVDLPNASVRVGGELDRDTAHHLLEAVEMLTTRSSRRWQLDAAGVTFCDAGGLRALTDAHAFAAAHGRSLRVVRSSRPVDRLGQLLRHHEGVPPPHPGNDAGARPVWRNGNRVT